MKRNLFIIFVCAMVFFFSSPAQSAEGLYLSGNVGLVMATDSDLTEPGITATAEFDTGWGLAAAVGYGMGQVRLEGEISYQKSDFDKISVPGASVDASGDMSSIAFLINGYFDFHNSSAFTPYISAGIGYAKIDLNDFNYPGSGEPNFSEDDSVFAYQFGLGAGYAVTEKVIVDLKYRYFATEDPEFDTTKAEAASHNVILGVRFYF